MGKEKGIGGMENNKKLEPPKTVGKEILTWGQDGGPKVFVWGICGNKRGGEKNEWN